MVCTFTSYKVKSLGTVQNVQICYIHLKGRGVQAKVTCDDSVTVIVFEGKVWKKASGINGHLGIK